MSGPMSGQELLVGSHVASRDPLGEAAVRDAACAQIFMSSPQQWTSPRRRTDRWALVDARLPLVVHAPYLVNLASPSETVRERSVRLLQETLDVASDVAAVGVVVHAGQAGRHSTFDEGLDRWLSAADAVRSDVPVWLENLAFGESAMGRYVDDLVTLVHAAAQLGRFPVGVCVDTCHAWAAGEFDDRAGADRWVGRLVDRVGSVDLLHVNGSRDRAGAGRDRHANLTDGLIPPAVIDALVAGSAAPLAVVETPGGPQAQADDIAWLRARLR